MQENQALGRWEGLAGHSEALDGSCGLAILLANSAMKCLTAVILLVLLLLLIPYSRTDAFEHSKGLEIINNSRLYPGFNILDMFGADLSSGPGQTIFDDRVIEDLQRRRFVSRILVGPKVSLELQGVAT